MKIFAVGGSVRDDLLQRPVKDRDYVVVGATPADMLALGYEQVGADFPVFLHPVSGCEYALARTERKTGRGYNGFTTDFDPLITLEDDLRRRDLTINAMARDLDTNELIDPFGGQKDLNDHVLRHVSSAFVEDPLRVLRVARFNARYGFKIAPETLELMSQLVSRGEVDDLTPERVWVELEKGLSEASPGSFILTLVRCDAWNRLFPEVKIGATFHQFRHSRKFSFNAKLMVLFSDTPDHPTRITLEKYRAPADTIRIVMNFKKLQSAFASRSIPMTGHDALKLLKEFDAFRRPEDFEAIFEPVFTFCNDEFSMFTHVLHGFFENMRGVNFASLSPEDQTLKGAEIGAAIDRERLLRVGVV